MFGPRNTNQVVVVIASRCVFLCVYLQKYSQAEKAMAQVLNLDKDCEEAVNDLFHCKVLQLMVNRHDCNVIKSLLPFWLAF